MNRFWWPLFADWLERNNMNCFFRNWQTYHLQTKAKNSQSQNESRGGDSRRLWEINAYIFLVISIFKSFSENSAWQEDICTRGFFTLTDYNTRFDYILLSSRLRLWCNYWHVKQKVFLKSRVARGECFRHSNRRTFLCGKFNIDFLWLDGNLALLVMDLLPPATEWGGKVMFSVAIVCLFTGEVPMWPLMDLFKLVHLGTPPPPAPASSRYRNSPPGHIRTCSLEPRYINTEWLEPSDWKAGGWPSTERPSYFL